MTVVLREDQQGDLDALREATRDGCKRICMQAATGYGKTVLAAALVNGALAKGKKVLFTVPAIDLIEQTLDMFARQGITEVGVIQADNPLYDWNQPVQIASVQTLMKRTIPLADVVLIDECHIWFTFYEKWLGTMKHPDPSKRHPSEPAHFTNVPVIGLSATPWTKGLGSWFDHFHKAATIQQMIDDGHLSPFKVFAPSHPDLSGVRTMAGDYHEGQLSEVMQDGKLVADIVETWLKHAEYRPTLCYAVDRAHAKKLQLKFQAAGVPCGYQDAFTPDNDKIKKKTKEFVEGRKTIKRKFHDGEYKVVCNVGTLTMGIDWDVRCISMCRPTKSDMLFTQIVGRGLRTADGKDHCLILDHSDNHLRLGFVTDIDESYTGLHDGQTPVHDNRTEGIRLPKECPKCGYLKLPKMAQCPACGFVAKVVSKIEPEPGELRELKPKPKPVKEAAPERWGYINEAHFFGELKMYARQHGYQSGWASNQFRERFGVWPNAYKDSPLQSVSPVTASWIKSRQIAYAKSKRRTMETAR